MRLSMVVLCGLALAACQNNTLVIRSADCAKTCNGCCDAVGTCLPGTAQDACGAPGEVCGACSESETCGEPRLCIPRPLVEVPPVADAGSPGDAGVTPVVDAGTGTPALDAGTPSARCPPDGWCVEGLDAQGQPLTRVPLRAVWARTPSDVWVVGDSATVLHFDGVTWAPVVTGLAIDLYGVWAAAANDVWVVGGSGDPAQPIGVVARFDGTSWNVVQRDLRRVDAVWGAAANDVWFAGVAGSLHHFDGTRFVTVASNTTKDIVDLSGSGGRVWAVGASGLILGYDGTAWSVVPPSMMHGLSSALAFSSSLAWVAGGNGAFGTWNGSSWNTTNIGNNVTVMGLWGARPNAVWAVGPDGEVRFFDGTSATLKVSGTQSFLRDVHGCDEAHVWAVGFNGTVLAYRP